MSAEPFSLAEAEALFGPENWERMGREVAAAPEFTPEQCEKFRALFATVRIVHVASPARTLPDPQAPKGRPTSCPTDTATERTTQ